MRQPAKTLLSFSLSFSTLTVSPLGPNGYTQLRSGFRFLLTRDFQITRKLLDKQIAWNSLIVLFLSNKTVGITCLHSFTQTDVANRFIGYVDVKRLLLRTNDTLREVIMN